MTVEERRKKQREYSKKHYMKNAHKINNARGLKCPCSRLAVTKLAGIPICSFCLNIEKKLGRF